MNPVRSFDPEIPVGYTGISNPWRSNRDIQDRRYFCTISSYLQPVYRLVLHDKGQGPKQPHGQNAYHANRAVDRPADFFTDWISTRLDSTTPGLIVKSAT